MNVHIKYQQYENNNSHESIGHVHDLNFKWNLWCMDVIRGYELIHDRHKNVPFRK